MKNTVIALLACFLVFACASDPASNLKPLNLLQYGVPISVLAPDSVEVKTMDLLVQKDITVKGPDNYDLQIFAADAMTTDATKIASELKAEVKNNPYFTRFVKEDDPNGFIYEIVVDSLNTFYGFQLVRIMGDREYVFQNALHGRFTRPEIDVMYNAVKGE